MRESKETLPAAALERLWAEHLAGEFEQKDVEATLATMVDDAYVNHVPVGTGGAARPRCAPSTATTSSRPGPTISS